MSSLIKNITRFFVLLFVFLDYKPKLHIKAIAAYQGGNPTRTRVWKMGRSFITKRQSGGHAAMNRGKRETAAGGIPLHGNAAFCSQKRKPEKNRFMSSQLPQAVNTSRAAASLLVSGSGTKFNETIKNKQNTWTAWEVEWDKNSRVRIIFCQLGLFFYEVVTLYNYLLLCVLPKCWFAALFNLALRRGLKVSVVGCCAS